MFDTLEAHLNEVHYGRASIGTFHNRTVELLKEKCWLLVLQIDCHYKAMKENVSFYTVVAS